VQILIWRNWQHNNPFIEQFAQFLAGGGTADTALLGFTTMNTARLLRESLADILGLSRKLSY
jgi:hypothetical protein